MTRKLFVSSYLSPRSNRLIACAGMCCILLLSIVLFSPSGHAVAATSTQITINASQSLGTVTNASEGINTAVWNGNMLDSAATTLLKNANVKTMRYPGGSTSDVYHWQSNTTVQGQSFANPSNTFDAFMGVVQAVGSDAQPIITVNYGSGTPQEAANWVQYANKGGPGYNGPVPTYTGGSSTGHTYGIKYWEVGNEVYGNGSFTANWEFDTHSTKGATAYAQNAVQIIQAMKAVDPTIKVGVVLTTPGDWPDGVVDTNDGDTMDWNHTVLSIAGPFIDFGDIHWYTDYASGGNYTDAGLLGSPAEIAGKVSTLRSLYGQFLGSRASQVGIAVTEMNSNGGGFPPGKQTVGLVNGLFLADAYMTWLENGVFNVDWWAEHNGISTSGDNSSSLYGTANFGDMGVLSNGSSSGGVSEPPADTPFPPYYALQMFSHLFGPGDTMVSSSSNQSLVAAHAVKQANGNLAVLLINKDPNTTYTIALSLNGYSAAANATLYTYGQNSSSITSAQGSPDSVSIAPYSLTTIVLQPGTGVTPTPTNTPTPIPTTTPSPTPSPTPSAGASCKVVYTITNQWNTGFGASIAITNTGTTAINGWNLQFSFANGQTITQLWNGTFTQTGAAVTISNLSYNGSIPAGATLSSPPGFNGSWSGTNAVPTSFTLNGAICSTS
ncbi:MAG TPA: cellulose binding domain-containing protein [Ktedonobacteraceae bacterium]|nr:cellulose binding domain-containing protein [Ktedonobacteraceae bacterium]